MKRFFKLKYTAVLVVPTIFMVTILGSLFFFTVRVHAKEKITITEFSIPFTNYPPIPLHITSGSDGNIWFTETNTRKLGRITTTGTITEFPYFEGGGWDITSGPDNNIWLTQTANIVRITPNGVITKFPLAESLDRPTYITSSPDGSLWFAVYRGTIGAGKIGRITVNGVITEFLLPSINKSSGDLTSGPDGNIWFIEIGNKFPQNNAIAKITPDGNITEFQLPSSTRVPTAITSGPDGNLWFTEHDITGQELDGARIGKITPEGIITEYSLPRSSQDYGTSLEGIAKGPDGNLWFTEIDLNKIGMITTDGKITEYEIPTGNSGAWDITAGPDGNLWFTESFSNKIGRVNLVDVKEPPGQNKNNTILSPFNNGVAWTVVSGYYNNRDQTKTGCHIGLGPDHCRNQLFGLDMVPDQQSDTEILAPANGKVGYKGLLETGCIGLRITLDNGLNMNVCHFADLKVEVGDRVLRGKVLGTRSTSWVHLSLDDRHGPGNLCPKEKQERCFLPIPFDAEHTIEGISFAPNLNGETVILPYPLCDKKKVVCQFKVGFQQYQGFAGTSTNIAIP